MKDLLELLKRNEKEVCVTIVLKGGLKSFDDKEQVQVRLKKIIATAKKVISAEYGEEKATAIAKELNTQLFNLDFGKSRESLVVYATEGFGKSFWLPFSEKERLTIHSSFDLQPLTDAMNRERDYWVLALSKSKTRLFRGKNEHLTEITNTNFPVAYQEQFQYEKPRFALSHKAGTYSLRDPRIDSERTHAFFRHIDHLLKPVLQKEDFPIILMGVRGNIRAFAKTSSFANKIAAEVNGNYDYHSTGQIAAKVWPLAREKVVPQVALEER